MVNNILIEFTKFTLAIVYFTVVFNVSGYGSGV